MKESFALIYSVEDPLGNTPLSGVGVQVMGPDDGYIVQFDKNVKRFWAERNKLSLGSCFERIMGQAVARRMVSKVIASTNMTRVLNAVFIFYNLHIYFLSFQDRKESP